MIEQKDITQIADVVWEIPETFRPDMKVPARFFASENLLVKIFTDRSLEQLINVATLPGIRRFSLAMPDIHEGYGFPIGGVAGIDAAEGVISPGGVGYDINCGVRLLVTPRAFRELGDKLKDLVDQIYQNVPSGVGRGGKFRLKSKELDQVLQQGARWLVEQGFGDEADLEYLEERGEFKQADPAAVSDRAKKRGQDQIGTLGAGNHFLEIQHIVQMFDQETANIFGLEANQICVMIHTGSRGLGHQVCTDYVRQFDRALPKFGIRLPDRELACAPFQSELGQRYFQAMAAAANFAWANRQLITHQVREAWQKLFDKDTLNIVYDVAHNIAKLEHFDSQELIVHRKGATRSYGPNQPEVPKQYRSAGQPVIIPGSMGTSSYVLVGTDQAMKETFGSTCHGAGRSLSRSRARKTISYSELKQRLEQKQGIILRSGSSHGLVEEAPEAYKDIDEVVETVCRAGLARKVVQLKPLAVVKG